MKFIKGNNRSQTLLFPISLDQSIDADNDVRIIDLFVDSLVLKDFGFKTGFVENGRPAYHPADLLKLYIYGYMNKMRSSRDLEKACTRNIEVMWLLNSLQPDHNTISNFRRDNPKAITKVFRATVQIAKHFELIGGSLLAGDSTKFRAQNSKKNNFNQKKIDRHVAYIDNKVEEFTKALETADGDTKVEIEQGIDKHNSRKNKYKQLESQLNESGENQISTSDPHSRHMIVRNNITEVAYNVQSIVDAKNCIPVDFKVTNTNDAKAMGNMLQRTKSILGNNDFTALFDKGYHTGSEFNIADSLNIEVLVAIPALASHAPTPEYDFDKFKYHKNGDYYTCPEGSNLTTSGTRHKTRTYHFKSYSTKDCRLCPAKSKCTKASIGKVVQRSEFQDLIDQNRINVEAHQNYYRQRQAIVEHPYGTIKRQWGFSYILTKKYIAGARADVGLMFTAYNLRRIMNILGVTRFKKYLEILVLIFESIISRCMDEIRRFYNVRILGKFNPQFINPSA